MRAPTTHRPSLGLRRHDLSARQAGAAFPSRPVRKRERPRIHRQLFSPAHRATKAGTCPRSPRTLWRSLAGDPKRCFAPHSTTLARCREGPILRPRTRLPSGEPKETERVAGVVGDRPHSVCHGRVARQECPRRVRIHAVGCLQGQSAPGWPRDSDRAGQIGRASCRERV